MSIEEHTALRKELLQMIGNSIPDQIAKSLVSVQPMNPVGFKEAMDEAMSEDELIANGYEPVCPHTRLMWRKKS